jgi:hypothetical protein
MKCARILPLAVVLAGTFAIAQDVVVKSGQENLSTAPTVRWDGPTPGMLDKNGFLIDPANCPVGLQVERRPGLSEQRNAQGPTINRRVEPGVLYQRLHLIMTNLLSRDITSAEITAHGFSDKSRTILLSNAAPDLAKPVNVALDVKGMGRASSDLALSHFTAVTSIDVDSVTYADGSTWHASSPGACSVTPSMIMRVSAAE